MALVGIELQTLVSEVDALTIRPLTLIFVYLHENYDRKFKDKPNCNEKYTKNINANDKKKNV